MKILLENKEPRINPQSKLVNFEKKSSITSSLWSMCNLCLDEKISIVKYKDGINLLNKRKRKLINVDIGINTEYDFK